MSGLTPLRLVAVLLLACLILLAGGPVAAQNRAIPDGSRPSAADGVASDGVAGDRHLVLTAPLTSSGSLCLAPCKGVELPT